MYLQWTQRICLMQLTVHDANAFWKPQQMLRLIRPPAPRPLLANRPIQMAMLTPTQATMVMLMPTPMPMEQVIADHRSLHVRSCVHTVVQTLPWAEKGDCTQAVPNKCLPLVKRHRTEPSSDAAPWWGLFSGEPSPLEGSVKLWPLTCAVQRSSGVVPQLLLVRQI